MPHRMIDSLIIFADEFPDTTALVDENEVLSYKEMLLRALNIADRFDQIGVFRVGLYRENSIEWILIDLAALIAKVTLVPIPSSFSDRQIKHLLAESSLDFILCDNPNRLKKIDPTFLDDGVMIGKTPFLWSPPKKSKGPAEGQSPAKITFTLEATHSPEGICLSFDAIDKISFSLSETLSHRLLFGHISLLPFSVLLENIVGVYVPLLLGRQVHVYPRKSLGFSEHADLDISRLICQLNRTQPDSMILQPEMLTALLATIEEQGPLSYTPSFIALREHSLSSKLAKKARSFGFPVYEGHRLEGLHPTPAPSIQALLSELNFRGQFNSEQFRGKTKGTPTVFLNNKKEELKWTQQPTSLS